MSAPIITTDRLLRFANNATAPLYVLEVHHFAVDFLVGAGPFFRLRYNIVTRRPQRLPCVSENAREATFAG